MATLSTEPGSPTDAGSADAELCPWCGQPIPHERFDEIRERIGAHERERFAELEGVLADRFEQEKAEIAAAAKADLERVQAEAATAQEKAVLEAQQRTAAAIEEAKKAAEARATLQILEAQTARETAEQQLAAALEDEQTRGDERLRQQREILEQAKEEAVNAEKSKQFVERQKLEDRLQQLQRQVQGQTSAELGEGAEVNLYEALRERFPHDDIRRVGQGKEGADIIHRVLEERQECGVIVYDSKNRTAWRTDYVAKLRRDQLALPADHAILASRVFPAGKRQLDVQDDVIILNPARAVVVVELLRRHLVQVHSLRLSAEARTEKMAAVYDFITSDRFSQLLSQIDIQAEKLLDLDVKEQKDHATTWRRRGQLIRSVQRAQSDLGSDIDRIVGAPVSARLHA